MRYTKRDAENSFRRLLRVLKKHEARSFDDVGGWVLDYNPIYGGVVIHEIVNKGGGVSTPFGLSRRELADFCAAIDFAIDAIGIKSR